jgi:hypothetical protein
MIETERLILDLERRCFFSVSPAPFFFAKVHN